MPFVSVKKSIKPPEPLTQAQRAQKATMELMTESYKQATFTLNLSGIIVIYWLVNFTQFQVHRDADSACMRVVLACHSVAQRASHGVNRLVGFWVTRSLNYGCLVNPVTNLNESQLLPHGIVTRFCSSAPWACSHQGLSTTTPVVTIAYYQYYAAFA
ncbi:hypothetical protein H4582DRAFT_2062659 [Lactarius indigo]|nr:hypothetical protein H4582DRAFT_2062659 [Lactarius indigo]